MLNALSLSLIERKVVPMAEKEAWNDGLRTFIGLMLLELHGAIVGYILVFCVFGYYHINMPIPISDIVMHSTGRPAASLAFFAQLPLLTFHFWNFDRIDFVKANPKSKWLSVPVALAFLFASPPGVMQACRN